MSTDDPSPANISLVDEWRRCLDDVGMRPSELRQMAAQVSTQLVSSVCDVARIPFSSSSSSSSSNRSPSPSSSSRSSTYLLYYVLAAGHRGGILLRRGQGRVEAALRELLRRVRGLYRLIRLRRPIAVLLI